MTTPWNHCCCIPPRSTKTGDEDSRVNNSVGLSMPKCQQKELIKLRKEARKKIMVLRIVLLPTALQRCSQQISSTKHVLFVSLQPPTDGRAQNSSWTHNEFPYEAMGIHRGTPAAQHHPLSFFFEGQLQVKGSIRHWGRSTGIRFGQSCHLRSSNRRAGSAKAEVRRCLLVCPQALFNPHSANEPF